MSDRLPYAPTWRRIEGPICFAVFDEREGSQPAWAMIGAHDESDIYEDVFGLTEGRIDLDSPTIIEFKMTADEIDAYKFSPSAEALAALDAAPREHWQHHAHIYDRVIAGNYEESVGGEDFGRRAYWVKDVSDPTSDDGEDCDAIVSVFDDGAVAFVAFVELLAANAIGDAGYFSPSADAWAIVKEEAIGADWETERDNPVPPDYSVRPIPSTSTRATVCGTCDRGWDDSIVTGMTPAPSGRCPFESFHEDEDDIEDEDEDAFTCPTCGEDAEDCIRGRCVDAGRDWVRNPAGGLLDELRYAESLGSDDSEDSEDGDQR